MPVILQDETRPVLSAKYLESTYEYSDFESQSLIKSTANYVKKYYNPSRYCCSRLLMRRIPFINWIMNYDLKEALLKDIVGGITIGVIQVPQAMAYSQMAGCPPANGLYVTFFHCLVYFFLGTSRHLSPGTFAIISLMIITSTNKYEGVLFPKSRGNLTGIPDLDAVLKNPDFISNDPVEARVLISTVLSMSSGIIMLLMAILHFGFVTKFLSDAIVGGLSVGAVFQVIISQIKVLLGIQLNPLTIPFVFLGTAIEIFRHIHKTNIACLVISIISLIVLMIFKIINDKYSHKFPAPLPIEIIAVIISTIISYFADFNGMWKVPIVGTLPLGFPTPRAPQMNLFITLIGDSISIAILTFALQVSFAKLFAKKHNYEISANQEFFAYGISNVVASFFSGYPGCVALSRCIIADGIGVKTQIVGGISALIMLIIIMALGPYLATLPNCVLAALIVVALIKKVFDVADFWKMFKKSKLDALAWLITFLGVVVFDVDIGLYVGLVSTLLLIILQSQRARTTIMGNIPGTNIFECVDTCQNALEYKNVKIIRYEESVYYANVDNFKYKILKLSGVKPSEVLAEIESDCKAKYRQLAKTVSKQKKLVKRKVSTGDLKFSEYTFDNAGLINVEESKENIKAQIRDKHLKDLQLKYLVLDMSCINYLDAQGIQAIMWIYEQYKLVGISVYLSYPKYAVKTQLKKFNLKYDTEYFFPSNYEAILYILRKENPNASVIVNECENFSQRVENSDQEEVTGDIVLYKAYKGDDEFYSSQLL